MDEATRKSKKRRNARGERSGPAGKHKRQRLRAEHEATLKLLSHMPVMRGTLGTVVALMPLTVVACAESHRDKRGRRRAIFVGEFGGAASVDALASMLAASAQTSNAPKPAHSPSSALEQGPGSRVSGRNANGSTISDTPGNNAEQGFRDGGSTASSPLPGPRSETVATEVAAPGGGVSSSNSTATGSTSDAQERGSATAHSHSAADHGQGSTNARRSASTGAIVSEDSSTSCASAPQRGDSS